MFWSSKKRVDERLAQMDAKIADSFNRVKQDTAAVYQWLDFFYEESNKQKTLIKHQRERIDAMKQELEELESAPKSMTDVKRIVDSFYDFDEMRERLGQLSERLDSVEEKARAQPQEKRVVVRETAPAARPVSALREKMMKKITRNSKDYIKSMIVSLIRKYNRISAMALREIVVDEQALCSKSSFYRLLEEIEKDADITVISSGREKVYVAELPKRARK
ncbi:hypothetical protein KY338_05390 [Candidatus Woesearchaeota archaeon]|nr:hypothetical protein [Candidatus Woesearchaeota archaeon]MBW3006336.1 hypothetical protein [Candidatus Woesearchaeota archaeon]